MIDHMSALPRFVALLSAVSTIAGDHLPGEFFRVTGRQGSFIKCAKVGGDKSARVIVSGTVLRPVIMPELDEAPFTAISVTDQDAQRKWFMAHGVRSIVLIGRRWLDGAGNTYHTVSVIVDGKDVHKSERAYGSDFTATAREWLLDAGYVVESRKDEPLWRMCDTAGIMLNTNSFDVTAKAAL